MRQIPEDRRDRLQSLSEHLENFATTRRKLASQTSDLDDQAAPVQREYNGLHNLDTPTSNTPDEVMAMIFKEGIFLERDSRVHFGELVSHISHRWRGVALATPSLWTKIRYTARTPVERVIAYLSRSRLEPFDLEIRGEVDLSLQSVLLQSLSDHIGRCDRMSFFDVDVTGDDLAPLLKRAFQQASPLLRSFRWAFGGGEFDLQGPLFEGGAPNLRIMDLDVPLDYVQAFGISTLKSITHLCLQGMHLDMSDSEAYGTMREVLMSLPSLAHLELVLEEMSNLAHLPPIVLPTVRFLHVANCCSSLNGIVKTFHSNSLTSLALSGWDQEFNDGALDRSNLGESYFPSLQHLIFPFRPPKDSREIHALSLTFQNIKRITCRTGKYGGNIGLMLDAIRFVRAWPELETIALSNVSKRFHCQSELCTYIPDVQRGCPLRNLLIPPDAPISLEYIAELRKFIDVGDLCEESPILIRAMF